MSDDPSSAQACKTCPWRIENHGRRHPDGWFSRANRTRLWAKLRRGDAMSCHRTDPGVEVSDKAVAAGFKRVPEGVEARECTGATILIQREFMTWQGQYAGDLRAYRKARPLGLTREGLMAVVQRVAFAGVPFFGGPKMDNPDLDAEGIDAGNGLDWKRPEHG